MDPFLKSKTHTETDIRKFTNNIAQTTIQLSTSSAITLPEIPTPTTPIHEIVLDTSLLQRLAAAMDKWTETLRVIIARETKRTPGNALPMGEIDFWKDRVANIRSLWEQMNAPEVMRLKEIVQIAENGEWKYEDGTTGGDEEGGIKDLASRAVGGGAILGNLNSAITDLGKLWIEASDNVKFLSTLERHFRLLGSGTLKSVQVGILL
jgi:dynein heavy chain